MITPQKEFMQAAIDEATKTCAAGDYAIGAVIVRDGAIVARGGNRAKLENDPTLHAEVVAIREACQALGSRYLENCVLYTTHEPCPMCATAAAWANIGAIVSGATMDDMADHRAKSGNGEFKWRTVHIPAREILQKSDPRVEIVEGFMREECRELFHS